MRQLENYGNDNISLSQWTNALGSMLTPEKSALYREAFSPGYQHDFDAATGAADIALIDQLDSENSIAMSLYRYDNDKNNVIRLRLVHDDEPIALSDVLPLLENFGLRVIGERPYQIRNNSGRTTWLHVFEMHYTMSDNIEIASIEAIFKAALINIWRGNAENDTFNSLLLDTKIDWRSIVLLRAYAGYMKQITFNYSQSYIASTMAKHSSLTSQLVNLFNERFDPDLNEHDRTASLLLIEQSILSELENVDNLTEDRIIQQYMTLIQATLRTNFFQTGCLGGHKEYLSLKFDVSAIPEVPKPRPMFEIYVYSPRVEGVHLRGGKVARGGLRWSDRDQDFRTEVLGLVKAQQVKNSVIVPVGAKGGFICKQSPENGSRDDIQVEGIACYRTFISGLLDITDNLVEGEVIPPVGVKRWDNDDPYLVVAADKGTATFSDIANEISDKYGFWLGDAFASGGSVGYDHKKMGITARGAWIAVQRHFRELGTNVQEEDFTVIGIGDMAGDVFGNGMLSSEHIRLLAAFNHLHIFIDPNPEAITSFAERKRLFELPRSSWDDYNRDLISQGGGIFLRSAKSIPISTAMQQRFSIVEDRLPPDELISAALKAPVDLLWNGGIGTYAKASTEIHTDVGDKANDSVRVNAGELGARVIGEGGNLGFTQLARVEFSLKGGRCNTDFIDNAGGVDCSDNEVNIKILLNALVNQGSMSMDERNQLLESMTNAVEDLVLEANYRQTEAISIAENEAMNRNIEYRRLIGSFESANKLDRELEFIPDDEALAERKASGKALSRPELSVLVSYSKILLKEALIDSDIANNEYMAQAARMAFPSILRERYPEQIDNHQLRKEIVATQITGDLVNRMGMTFVHRMQQATGETEANIAKAYVTARDLFDIDTHWKAVEALDYKVSSDAQFEMMAQLNRLTRRSTRWLLRSRRSDLEPQREINYFSEAAKMLAENMEHLLRGDQKLQWQEKIIQLLDAGLPERLAHFIAGARYFYTAFAIAEASEVTGVPVLSVAETYFCLGNELELNWFADCIAHMNVENYWQAMARESFRDDLEWQQRCLSLSIVNIASELGSNDKAMQHWIAQHDGYISRWRSMMSELRGTNVLELAMFPVAIRELLDLSQASEHAA